MNKMKKLLSLCGMILLVLNLGAATNDSLEVYDQLRAQSQKMAETLVDGKYKEFVKYTHPTIVKLAGGEDKIIKGLEGFQKTMDADGMKIKKVEITEISKVISYNGQLQCTLTQLLTLKLKEGSLLTEGTLVGVSMDNGRNWTFLDTQRKPLSKVKEMIPELSDELVIPERKEPVMIAD